MGKLDINVGKLKKNAFRYSKVRGETAARIRIPGGVIDADSLAKVVEIAEKYGQGVIDLTNRQGIEIPGIKMEDMDKVNAEVQPIIDALHINQSEPGKGYPSSGTRNIEACPGSRLCPFGCFDTTAFASSNHTHPELSGLTSSTITKETGTFTNLVVASASFTATNVEAEEISASTATFGDINVTGTASLSTTNVTASTLTAGAGSFTTLTVGGSSVALVGHTHPASEVTGLQSVLDGLSSTYALASHSHAISDITNLSPILSGITSSSVEKDTVTADIGYFRLLSVSGSANFAVNNVSANSVTVNGTEVALSGHTHSVADIDGLSTTLQAYASASHFHSISDITNLQTTLSGFASSGHTHDELSGLTSSTIDRLSGSFNALTASTATFGSINVANSATFDITNLVADAITVSDLNLTGTLSVSSTSVSSMTVTDLSVTGTLTLNSKSIATQEYVQLMISQAIGQILASAY